MSDLEIEAENRRTLAERTISDEQQLADALFLIDQDLADKKQALLDAEQQARRDANFQTMNQAVSVGQNVLGSMGAIQQETINQQQSALDAQLKAGTISQKQFDKRSDKLRKTALKKERKNAMLQILISTAQGVAQAVKAGAGVPFPGNLLAIASGLAAVLAGIAQAKAVSDTYSAANIALKTGGGFPLGVPGMLATIAQGLANVMQISKSIGEMKTAATGFDGVVNKPTMFLTGEAGAENVQITPLEGPNLDGPPSGGTGVTVNVSGNVMSQDFVEGELADAIKEAVRRGTDFGEA